MAGGACQAASSIASRPVPRSEAGVGQPARGTASRRPEGRWSRIDPPTPSLDDPETALSRLGFGLARSLTGCSSRETVEVDPWAPAWRDLAPWLARGRRCVASLRRGYFVEGLSGVQYANARGGRGSGQRSASGLARSVSVEPVLLASVDPANVYGSGAPLDIPLAGGGNGTAFAELIKLSGADRGSAGLDRRRGWQTAHRAGFGVGNRAETSHFVAPDSGGAASDECSRSRLTTRRRPWQAPPLPGWRRSGFVRDPPGHGVLRGMVSWLHVTILRPSNRGRGPRSDRSDHDLTRDLLNRDPADVRSFKTDQASEDAPALRVRLHCDQRPPPWQRDVPGQAPGAVPGSGPSARTKVNW